MKVRASSKSGLFLIELIIAIAFFAVTSAICIQLFVKAHTLSASSRDLSRSVTVAQSAAEVFKAAGNDIDALAGILGADPGAGSVTAYYDAGWQQVGERDPGGYTMVLSLYQDGVVLHADITVTRERGAQQLYTLQAARYE